jgi:uncharacterized caspase-like protein
MRLKAQPRTDVSCSDERVSVTPHILLSLTLSPLFFILIALAPLSSRAETGGLSNEKFALVVGNGAYTEGPLANPTQDAVLMGQTLKSLGFTLIGGKAHTNLKKEELSLHIIELGDQLRRTRGVGFFYFAGHGMQIEGQNYLIPVGAKLDREEYIRIYGVSMEEVMNQMESAQNRLNLIVLDACRNNPFTSAYRSATRGLKLQSAPGGTMVLYSTRPGKVSLDGDSRNSPFTLALTQQMRKPGLNLEEVMRATINEVERETKGQQTPWQEGFVRESFSFNPAPVAAPMAAAPMAAAPVAAAPMAAAPMAAAPMAEPFAAMPPMTTALATTAHDTPSFFSVTPTFTYIALGAGVIAHALNLVLPTDQSSVINGAFYGAIGAYVVTGVGVGVGVARMAGSTAHETHQQMNARALEVPGSRVFTVFSGEF